MNEQAIKWMDDYYEGGRVKTQAGIERGAELVSNNYILAYIRLLDLIICSFSNCACILISTALICVPNQ